MMRAGNSLTASIATLELRTRIRRERLEECLAGLAFELCIEGLPAEAVFQRLHDKAFERMVRMLDKETLDDVVALKGCLQLAADESQRVALEALEKGTEMLHDGLEILEHGDDTNKDGSVN